MAEHTMLDNLVIIIEDTIRVLIEINTSSSTSEKWTLLDFRQ